ncbi:DUF6151 family protein [Parvularcula sp. LCG005]|uniref:DUF6151 family protein n=1 Tax=Parvularcula sp. LCG005 TaxID=3078805 RepID=UPI0029424C62|nr:DUF6151 family protein [Parvularcula sp. LCG005]WOI54406.1 DUF6151 family protein [Parvularcula sp. LCG005]
MTDDHYRVQCDCGLVTAVVGDLRPATCNHVKCYCKDCQAFAHFLGRNTDVLDEQGGTDIAQISAGRLTFRAGTDKVAGMRMSESGLMRWYASCCRTPIANTAASAKLPFIGLIAPFMTNGEDEGRVDAALGPFRGYGFVHGAKGDRAVPGRKHEGFLAIALQLARIMIPALLTGAARKHPFFDADSGAPISEPTVLSEAERVALREKVDADRL